MTIHSTDRRFRDGVRHGAVLLPTGLAALAALAAGRPAAAHHRLGAGTGRAGSAGATGDPGAADRAVGVAEGGGVSEGGVGRMLAGAAATTLLGLLSLIPLGVELLAVLRGALYGLVDRGPYDTSWGGPSRAGAWLAHAAVAVPMALAGLVALWLLAGLQHRLVARLDGRPAPGWTVPVTVLTCAAAAVLVVAWIRQI